jgi:uncharacterized protein (TIGR03435 family)
MLVVGVAFCQSVNQPRGYKAAVVTPYSDIDGPPGITGIPPSPLVLTGFTLQDLIAFAHGGSKFEVIEGPSWVGTDRWNVRLEVEPPIMRTEQHGQILLAALRDQFEMTTHRESKLRPVYDLTLADTGSKLKSDDFLVAADPDRKLVNGSIHLRNTSVDTLAGLLSLYLRRPVVNRTNMTGLFRFSLDWPSTPGRPIPRQTTTDDLTVVPPLLRAVQQQLGLRLNPGYGSVDVFVIDKTQKPR